MGLGQVQTDFFCFHCLGNALVWSFSCIMFHTVDLWSVQASHLDSSRLLSKISRTENSIIMSQMHPHNHADMSHSLPTSQFLSIPTIDIT